MIQRWIEYWIPTTARSNVENYRQVRLTVILSFVCLCSGIFYVPMQYFALMFPQGAAISCMGMLQVVLGLALLRRGMSWRIATHNLSFTYFWILSFIAMTTGGIESSATAQFICIPLLAMMLLGKRVGWAWLAVCLAEIGIWSVLRLNGFIFPSLYPPAFRSMLYVTGLPGAIATLFLISSSFEHAKTLAKEQSEELLTNILPVSVAERVKLGETTIIDSFPHVSIVFADIVDFTAQTQSLPPKRIVEILNAVFTALDVIAERYGLEKIKTIGDCYMLVGGAPHRTEHHLERSIRAALDIQQEIRQLGEHLGLPITMRIGIHTGSAVAGIIGTSKFSYDLWGDTVNVASRMESHGTASRIHCTEAVYRQLCHLYTFEERGEIEIKGKGKMRTYFLGTSEADAQSNAQNQVV